MKKILIGLLLLPVFGFAQTDSTKFEFSIIDSAKGSKTELFTYAKSWMARSFVSSKAVIEMEDKEAGEIVGNSAFVKRENGAFGNQVGLSIIKFSIHINTKDDKYRCVLSGFSHSYLQTASTYNPNQSISMNQLTKSLASSQNGGSLDDEKPDCGGLFMTKKQWNKIKEYAKSEALNTIESFKKGMNDGKINSDF